MSPPPAKKRGANVVKIGAIGVAAYIVGVIVSPYMLPIDFLSSKLSPREEGIAPTTTPPTTPPIKLPAKKIPTVKKKVDSDVSVAPSLHESTYKSIVNFETHDPFFGVDIVVHRNGEPDPCAQQDTALNNNYNDSKALSPLSKRLLNAINAADKLKKTLNTHDKYDFDAILTHSLTGSLLEDKGSSCGATWNTDEHYLDNAPHLKNSQLSELIKFCDMGIDKTPIQLDHQKMAMVPEVGSMPCHFHTREGVRIASLEQLAELAQEAKAATNNGQCTPEQRNADGSCNVDSDGGEGERKELHLYAVQAGRVFIFAPKYVGEIFELPHVKVDSGLPVWLEVISLSPRVFDVFNFFDRDESAKIVDKALKETSETHRMKRSSTGASGYNVNSQRTSENGFDTHGKEAQVVKRRCIEVLGFDEYEESLTDGLQVLRYNKTTAYIPHLDWIDDYQKQQEHDFDSSHLGSNRFATILLYMSNISEGDGGETVFTHGWPPNQAVEDRVEFIDAKAALRESGDVEGLLEPNSWQEQMVARCRSRLAVRPHSSRAVLFYSQNPDGTPDKQSLHGGCPVIQGEKWAANLWVWNAPRGGFPGSPVNQEVVDRNRASGKQSEEEYSQKKASFTNTQTDETMRDAELYFQDTFWSKLGFADPQSNVNTFEGHQWNIKVGDKIVKTFAIDKTPVQKFTI